MNNPPPRTIYFSFIVFAAAVVVALSWPVGAPAAVPATRVSASVACADIAPSLSLVAEGAYAVDLSTGTVLYAKNAETPLPLASVTKLMTVLVASRVLAPDSVVTITPEALATEGDAGFVANERWTFQDLVDYTLTVSANDGAEAIALAAAGKEDISLTDFYKQMNDEAQALGMYQTFYASATGLDISTTTAGSYGTARDMAILLDHIVSADPRLIEGTDAVQKTFTSLSGYTHLAKNTSSVVGSLLGAIGQKTGYTDLAGGNLVEVFEPMPGHPVAAVILGSTLANRDNDMEMLAAGATDALKRMLLCQDGLESP
ncbi:MAG: D-alanyl-D-alanine carboxypeptidase [Patescibacteria group bacterium]|nr:D-alanyl-D-alanine carboxypeptidase [Patescibacteria group bacterium]